MTLTEAIERLEGWQAAEQAVMKGQSYSIEGMSVTRVDSEKIQAAIDRYNRIILQLQRQNKSGSAVGRAKFY